MYFDVAAIEYTVQGEGYAVEPHAETYQVGNVPYVTGIQLQCETVPVGYSGSGNDGYSCHQCSKKFSIEASLKKHVALTHGRPSEQKQKAVAVSSDPERSTAGRNRKVEKARAFLFQCTQCADKFAGLDELEAHMEVHLCRKPYKCSLCDEAFSLPTELGQHIETHSTSKCRIKRQKLNYSGERSVFNGTSQLPDTVYDKPYKCPWCSSSFKRSCDLNAHKKRGHRADRPHRCSLCTKNFRLPRELEFHMLYHGPKPYRCPYCELVKKDFSNLRLHVKHRHWIVGPPVERHPCSVCKTNFKSSSSLEFHMLSHSEKPYPCPYCKKLFTIFSNLRIHVKKNHRLVSSADTPITCGTCKINFKMPSDLAVHMLCHGEKQYRCPYCENTSFDELSYFKQHVRSHNLTLPFVCQVCERKFGDRYSWRRHQSKHSDITPRPCSQCDRTFLNVALLDDHLRVYHDPNRFPCTQCTKSFSSETILQKHLNRHLSPRPIKQSEPKPLLPCPHCNRTFIVPNALERHVQLHYDNSIHWCSDCGRSFSSWDELRLHHERKHVRYPEQLGGIEGIIPAQPVKKTVVIAKKDIPCPKCDQMFGGQSLLKYHMKTHDQRWYGCSQCGRSFFHMEQLLKHVQKYDPCGWCKCIECGEEFEHGNELQEHLMTSHSRPFKCEECDESFLMMRELLKHARIHVPIRVIVPAGAVTDNMTSSACEDRSPGGDTVHNGIDEVDQPPNVAQA